jgi:hypothetical protein
MFKYLSQHRQNYDLEAKAQSKLIFNLIHTLTWTKLKRIVQKVNQDQVQELNHVHHQILDHVADPNLDLKVDEIEMKVIINHQKDIEEGREVIQKNQVKVDLDHDHVVDTMEDMTEKNEKEDTLDQKVVVVHHHLTIVE